MCTECKAWPTLAGVRGGFIATALLDAQALQRDINYIIDTSDADRQRLTVQATLRRADELVGHLIDGASVNIHNVKERAERNSNV